MVRIVVELTLITHFYNEEFLLPFWIQHHKDIADRVILINHASTDRSVEIIQKLAPNWTIVESDLEIFDPVFTDFEVQKIEEKVQSGWKICLNTTEFLSVNVKLILSNYDTKSPTALRTSARIMLDLEPSKLVHDSKNLIEQKKYFIEDDYLYDIFFRGHWLKKIIKRSILGKKFVFGRQRIIHNFSIGGYQVGRHNTNYPVREEPRIIVFWFGYSPWCRNGINRKLGISKKLPGKGYDTNLGAHHKIKAGQLDRLYKKHLIFYKVLKFLNKSKVG